MTKEFDARNERKSRSVCAAMAESADTGKRVLSEREKCILDMWPRFEDGEEPVMIGDEVNGLGGEIVEVYITENEVAIWNNCANHMHLRPGERVKRPALKVLDADGVEIKVGDKVYAAETGCPYIVRVINGSGTIELKGFDDKGWSPKFFTHIQPAIGADGVPIKIGDTVWHRNGFSHGVVTSTDEDSLMGTIRYVNGSEEFIDVARYLTHTRPDSWKRLEEDARKGVCEYAGAYRKSGTIDSHECDGCRFDDDGNGPTCEQQMALDIIRRAKALAGIEVE